MEFSGTIGVVVVKFELYFSDTGNSLHMEMDM